MIERRMNANICVCHPIEPCRRVFGYDYTNRKNRLNTKI